MNLDDADAHAMKEENSKCKGEVVSSWSPWRSLLLPVHQSLSFAVIT